MLIDNFLLLQLLESKLYLPVPFCKCLRESIEFQSIVDHPSSFFFLSNDVSMVHIE